MYGADRQDRWASACAAALLMAGIGYLLVAGLGGQAAQRIADELKVIAVLPEQRPPPPDPVPARKQAEKRREGAASPPNLKAQATPIVAPLPVLRAPPPPVAVAPVAGVGIDPSAGAALVVGPGTGSGGIGNGTGSGEGGDGDGGGGGIRAEVVRFKLRYRDLPQQLRARLEEEGTPLLIVEFSAIIDTRGRLGNCRVTRSSGDPELDEATCVLAIRETRFRPARNETGRTVTQEADFEQKWELFRYQDDNPPH